MRSKQVGKVPEAPQGLPLFLDLSLTQRVPQLYGLGWLDEKGARAAGLVMDDPGRSAPGIAPDRNDVAISPHCYRRVGSHRAALQTTKQRIKPPEQALPGRLNFAPGSGQPGTRGVQQVPIRVYRLIQPPLQRLFRQGAQQLSGKWREMGHALQIGVNRARSSEHLEQS